MTQLARARFDEMFASRAHQALPGLIPYVTAGFPGRDDTVALLRAAQESGCIAAEVGIPFSDPLADGPVIQPKAGPTTYRITYRTDRGDTAHESSLARRVPRKPTPRRDAAEQECGRTARESRSTALNPAATRTFSYPTTAAPA